MLLSLINNVAFLVALVAAGQIVLARFHNSAPARRILLGLLFGCVTLLGMANPVSFAPGVIFDGRSIVLSVAGVVGGGVVAAIAAGMAAVYRQHLGGVGAPVGIMVILMSALLGVLARAWWQRRKKSPTPLHYLSLGVVVQLAQLAAFTQIPNRAAYPFIEQAWWVLLLFFPLATMLLCLIFREHEQHLESQRALLEEMRSKEQALRESEKRYRILAERSPLAIQVFSPDGTTLRVNHAWEEMWQATLEDLRHYNVFQDQQLESLGILPLLKKVFAGETVEFPEHQYHKPSGQPGGDEAVQGIWLRTHAYPVTDESGQVLEVVVIHEDVTARKLTEANTQEYQAHLQQAVATRTRELFAAKQAAESANIAKSAFLSNMSHEIRTPLNAITGMAGILRRSGITSEQADKLDKIETAGNHLLSIINAVLDLSKIEAGKFTLEVTPVHVEAMLGSIASMLGQKARDKGLQFNIEAFSPPYNLEGDATRLQQALLNYVANAVKFTERGHITLRAREESQTDTNVTLCFEVEDSGPGIAAEAIPKLFGAFEQADNSTTRKYGGTGLGLAITKKLAELMGGTAGVSSVEGEGSRFWFTSVLKKGAQIIREAARPEETNAEQAIRRRHAGKRVLVAEDEPINREISQMLLEDVDLVFDVAMDGQEVVDKAGSACYALILMDMQMPVQDGLAATRQIRQLGCCPDIPIIAMTANAFVEDKMRCLEAGMDDFIAKPVSSLILYTTLLKWLDKPRA